MDADRQENMIHAPARGVAGKAVSHTGGLYGASDPLYSTRCRSMTSNHLQALPYSDAFHRRVHHESDHTRAETRTCTRCKNACGGRRWREAGRMERQANEERSE